MFLGISVLSLLLACKSQTEIDLLSEKSKESPLKGKTQTRIVLDAVATKPLPSGSMMQQLSR